MVLEFIVLIIIYFFLSIFHVDEAEQRRKEYVEICDRADVNRMGCGRDNIYQFKVYCHNMRCLLLLAQKDGIGVGEERNESYYDRHRDEISTKYCMGLEPTEWCMGKAIQLIKAKHYVNSWFGGKGGEYWGAIESGYDELYPDEAIRIRLPKDGITNGEYILRGLYNLNQRARDGDYCLNNIPEKGVSKVGTWGEAYNIRTLAEARPTRSTKWQIPIFEKSGITLYN